MSSFTPRPSLHSDQLTKTEFEYALGHSLQREMERFKRSDGYNEHDVLHQPGFFDGCHGRLPAKKNDYTYMGYYTQGKQFRQLCYDGMVASKRNFIASGGVVDRPYEPYGPPVTLLDYKDVARYQRNINRTATVGCPMFLFIYLGGGLLLGSFSPRSSSDIAPLWWMIGIFVSLIITSIILRIIEVLKK